MSFITSTLSYFLGSYFQSEDIDDKIMKRTLTRRSSKRFVIGDEDEELGSPEIEITIAEAVDTDNNENIQNSEWLAESSRLKPGATLT